MEMKMENTEEARMHGVHKPTLNFLYTIKYIDNHHNKRGSKTECHMMGQSNSKVACE